MSTKQALTGLKEDFDIAIEKNKDFAQVFSNIEKFIAFAKKNPVNAAGDINNVLRREAYEASFFTKLFSALDSEKVNLRENALNHLRQNYKGDLEDLIENRNNLANGMDASGNPISPTVRKRAERLIEAYDALTNGTALENNPYYDRAMNLANYEQEISEKPLTTMETIFPEFSRRVRDDKGAFSRGIGAVKDILRFPGRAVRPAVQSLTPLGNDGLSYAESVGMPDKYKSGGQELFDEIVSIDNIAQGPITAAVKKVSALPKIGPKIAQGARALTGGTDVQRAIARANDLGASTAMARSVVSNAPSIGLDVAYEATRPSDEEGSPWLSLAGGAIGSAGSGLISRGLGNQSAADVANFANDVEFYRLANPATATNKYEADLIERLKGWKESKHLPHIVGDNDLVKTKEATGLEALKGIVGDVREKEIGTVVSGLGHANYTPSELFSDFAYLSKPVLGVKISNEFGVDDINLIKNILNSAIGRISDKPELITNVKNMLRSLETLAEKQNALKKASTLRWEGEMFPDLTDYTLPVDIKEYTNFRTLVRELKEGFPEMAESRKVLQRLEDKLKEAIESQAPEIKGYTTDVMSATPKGPADTRMTINEAIKLDPRKKEAIVDELTKELGGIGTKYETYLTEKVATNPNIKQALDRIQESYVGFAKLYNLGDELPSKVTSQKFADAVDTYIEKIGTRRLNYKKKQQGFQYMLDTLDDLQKLTQKGGNGVKAGLLASNEAAENITSEMVKNWEDIVMASLARKLESKTFWSDYFDNNTALSAQALRLAKEAFKGGFTKGKLRQFLQQLDLMAPVIGNDKDFFRPGQIENLLIPQTEAKQDGTTVK